MGIPARVLTPTEMLANERHKKFQADIAARARALTTSKTVKAIPRFIEAVEDPTPTVTISLASIRQELCGLVEQIDEAMSYRAVSVQAIQNAVAKYFRVAVREFSAERRTLKIAHPRQVAFYLCRELTSLSLPAIGKRFGDRDHTTVLHGIRKIERLMRADSDVAFDVACLIEEITGIQQ